jgi:hypothetical protein
MEEMGLDKELRRSKEQEPQGQVASAERAAAQEAASAA